MSEITPEMESELRRRIQTVIEAREIWAILQQRYDEAYSAWKDANADLIDEREAAKEDLAGAELMLRGFTVAVFQETQNKAPYPGVAVREVPKIEYPAQEAFAWAKDHDMALTLDTKAFEKIALATLKDLKPEEIAQTNMPFVKVTKEPQGTIATKLELKDKE